MLIAPQSFAPMELGLDCDRCSYNIMLLTELTRLVAAEAALRNPWIIPSEAHAELTRRR